MRARQGRGKIINRDHQEKTNALKPVRNFL